jgi:anti-sigma factor RsiW
MSDWPAHISDEALSDYLDGRGDPQMRLRVAAAIERNPLVAARFSALKANDEELRSLGADILAEAVPERLRSALQQAERPAPEERIIERRPAWRFRFARIVPLAVSVAAGIAIGWWGHVWRQDSSDDLLEPFIRQALLSHQLFEASGNLESLRGGSASASVSAIDTPFLTPVRLPENLDVGYYPVMVRSVQGSGGAGLQIAYVQDDGDWVSLMVSQHSDQDEMPVQLYKEEGRSVLYWLDGPLLYALVGTGDEDGLRRLARSLYSAPALGGGWSEKPTRPAVYVFD